MDDGTVFIGAVVSQDSKVTKIHTVNGIISVPTNAIVQVNMK